MQGTVSWIRFGLLLGLVGVVLLLVAGPQDARAASPIYVRTDGDDSLCDGTVDASGDPLPGPLLSGLVFGGGALLYGQPPSACAGG